MSATSSPDSKRMKTVHSLIDLPSEQLAAIAEYLPKLSRAIFAVALTAPPESFRATGWKGKPSDSSNAVIATAGLQCWEELEFCDPNIGRKAIDYKARGLFGKLTDNDIGAMLICVNAKNNLKKLIVPYVSNIVGYGLEPLCGSIVLEEIHLGSWYHWECGSGKTEPKLSASTIVSILDTIIDAQENNLHLRKILFPLAWRHREGRNETSLRRFYTKFNQFLRSKDIPCTYCPTLCSGEDENRHCQCCFRRICTQCNYEFMNDDEAWNMQDRHFVLKCGHCNVFLCSSCGNNRHCEKCNSIYCFLCAQSEEVDAVVYCENYECIKERTCMACKVPEEQNDCWGCKLVVYPKIMSENNGLTNENEELRAEVEQLRKKLSSRNDCK